MRTSSRLLLACLLALPAAAAAEEKPDRAAEIRAEIAQLETERDAASVRANTFVLPKDKLEVQAKQKQIDELQAELEALGKGAK